MFEDFRLKVFATVAEVGSFTKTAKMLGISQAAVSQNIAELEKAAGLKLFKRLPREALLTEAGKVMLRHACDIDRSYDHVKVLFTRIEPFVLRISASDEIYSYFIDPLLADFILIHPEIDIERVSSDDADLVIRMVPASRSLWDIRTDSLARIRVGVSAPPKNMGDSMIAHEKYSYFDLLYLPSPAFCDTGACRSLKAYLQAFL